LQKNPALMQQMSKTKMCQFHAEGKCTRGSNCTFAHGDDEMKRSPDLRKTRICQSFSKGTCDLSNDECNFAHGEQDLRSNDFCYKTSLCKFNQTGKCSNGERCRFAHGKQELTDEQDEEHDAVDAEDDAAVAVADVKRKADGSGDEAPDRKKPSKRQEKQRMRALAKRNSGIDLEAIDDPDKVTSPICAGCYSTVATTLGMAACAVCRYTSFCPPVSAAPQRQLAIQAAPPPAEAVEAPPGENSAPAAAPVGRSRSSSRSR